MRCRSPWIGEPVPTAGRPPGRASHPGGLSLLMRRVLHTHRVDDPFDFQALRIRQPGKLLPNRASYEIFNEQRQLLATATETEAHHRLKLFSKPAPTPACSRSPRRPARWY